MPLIALLLSLSLLIATGISGQSSQLEAPTPKNEVGTYPDTSEGLQSLVRDILQAAKARETAKEAELIHGLLIPNDSTWFTDEYGPGFGASLAAAYRRGIPGLEQEIGAIFEGNVQRGWTTPKILRYTDPESVNAPLDHFLNCMNQIVPLYATAFQGNGPSFVMSLKAGEKAKQAAGDLDGYFVYDRGGFRFIPLEILLKLPSERPVRIRLDLNVMESKLITKVPVLIPEEAIKKHTSGRVLVEVVIGVEGNIKETRLVEGAPILAAAVMDAVKRWRFAPTRLDGDAVEVDLQIPFTFEIH